MKKKDVIKLIVICLVFLVMFVSVLFIQLKDRLQTPYESDALTRLVDIYEVKQISKTDNITKIEVLSQTTKNEFTSKEDIEKVVSFLETVEGYKISSSLVSLTSNTYGVLVYCGSDEPIQISLSPMNFSVEKNEAYKNKYYKNAKNYYVLIENLMEEMRKD